MSELQEVEDAVTPPSDNLLVATDMVNAVEIYSDRLSLGMLLDDIKSKALAVESDVTTAKGRNLIAGIAYKVVRSKTYLDGLGKGLVAEMKRKVAAVDSERKYVRDSLDELRDRIRKPLDEWEAVDQVRKDEHHVYLNALDEIGPSVFDTPADIEMKVVKLTTIMDREWEEFGKLAATKSAAVLKSLEFAKEGAEARAKEELERRERERVKQEEMAAEKAQLEAERRELAQLRAKLAEERKAAKKEAAPAPVPVPQPAPQPEPESDLDDLFLDPWDTARAQVRRWITDGQHPQVTAYIAYLENHFDARHAQMEGN
jgi:hypothetical protein